MKNARGTHQGQVNFTKKTTPGNHSSDTLTAACLLCHGDHTSHREQHCPVFGKRCNNCGISGHFARACTRGTRTGRRRQQQSNFVQDDPDEEAFVVNCQAVQVGAKKFLAHLHLIHRRQSKVVQVQIDSASTSNTMPSSVLSQLFPDVKITKTESRISTYGSQTMKPKGQVTPVCERKGKLHTIDFLVLNVSGNKPPLLSGRDKRSRGGDHMKLAQAACTQQINLRGHPKALPQRFQTRTRETSWEHHAHRLGSVCHTHSCTHAPRSSGKIRQSQ